jgi:hypothetical protein
MTSVNRIRVTTPAAVATIAAANHVPFTATARAASVRLGGDVYFWAAA